MSQSQIQRNNGCNNTFKRAVTRGGVLTDAINPDTIGDIVNERPNTTMVQNNGQTFIKLLPTKRQRYSDAAYLKKFPQYRLVEEVQPTTTSPPTTEEPSSSLIDPNLNEDVTEFLSLLNDIGLRISYYYDPDNTREFERTRDIVGGDKLLIDTVSSNIIRGVKELKTFFRCFGKKILPPSLGFNPYHNNDISGLKNPEHEMDNKEECCRRETNVTVNVSNNNGVEYPKAPYNPDDLNTYMNCLENLAHNVTQRDPIDEVKDFNIKIFHTFLNSTKTTKFDDESIDEYLVTRPQPYYNVMHMMIEILKIDSKFFKILYLLNLHEAFRSPITGIYYGKSRTRMIDGIPVRYEEVTNSDIYNATIQVVDMLSCALKMVSFLDNDAYNKIVVDYFSEEAIKNGNNEPAIDPIQLLNTAQNISNGPAQFPTDTNSENIPCFLYGHLLNYCDAARQIVEAMPLEQEILDENPNYDPTRIANIAVNTTYGMMAVAQLIECLLKSAAFRTVMSMLFPAGDFRDSSTRDISEKYRLDRPNKYDLLSLTNYVLEGRLGINKSRIVAPNTIPNYLPIDPIHINKPLYCDINKTLCGLGRFLWNSGAVYLDCDVIPASSGLFNTSIDPYEIPPELTTTLAPEERDLDIEEHRFKGIINKNRVRVKAQNRAVRSKKIVESISRFTDINPNDNIQLNNSEGTLSEEPYVLFLESEIPDSIVTSNGKIISFLQCYVAAFANYNRETFNDKVRVLNNRSIERKPRLARDMYSILTRNMKI